MKLYLTCLITLALLASCSPTPTQSPDMPATSDTPSSGPPPIYAPRPGDNILQRGNVFIDSVDLLTMESFPVQYSITLKGGLPTPCHELRVVYREPGAENKIVLEVYSVVDPNLICVEVIQPFEQNVYLGSFPAGHYTIWINDKMMAEFDA
ncbi:MAG: hypothetical protein AB1750_01815 [Chloroflexota bacterium]